MAWSLEITDPARKDLADLPGRDRQAIGRALERLVSDPHAVDLRKLTGREDEWRLRVGRRRAILRLENATGTIYVLRVLARARAYRD